MLLAADLYELRRIVQSNVIPADIAKEGHRPAGADPKVENRLIGSVRFHAIQRGALARVAPPFQIAKALHGRSLSPGSPVDGIHLTRGLGKGVLRLSHVEKRKHA